jgi:transcriptional regulator with XRE-family HTH domain
MSVEEVEGVSVVGDGIAELTPLGVRVEILRIERALSKQRLAQRARTSRQQLWRVMTGKSELTTSLRTRLAAALAIDAAALAHDVPPLDAAAYTPNVSVPPVSVADYLTNAEHLAVTLRSLPSGDAGRRLKRTLLNAVEDLAVEMRRPLPLEYSEIHRRVVSGEL